MNITQILKILANDKRLQIIEWLKDPEKHFPSIAGNVCEKGVCVGLIEKKIDLSQSTVSHYLSQLEQIGIVIMQREGQWTFYKYNKKFTKRFTQELTKKI